MLVVYRVRRGGSNDRSVTRAPLIGCRPGFPSYYPPLVLLSPLSLKYSQDSVISPPCELERSTGEPGKVYMKRSYLKTKTDFRCRQRVDLKKEGPSVFDSRHLGRT